MLSGYEFAVENSFHSSFWRHSLLYNVHKLALGNNARIVFTEVAYIIRIQRGKTAKKLTIKHTHPITTSVLEAFTIA